MDRRSKHLSSEEQRAAWFDEKRASIDMTADLGATILTVVSGGTELVTKGTAETQKILSERLSKVVDFSAQRVVRLALEPLNPMFVGNRTCLMSVRDALNVCETVGSDALGIAVVNSRFTSTSTDAVHLKRTAALCPN